MKVELSEGIANIISKDDLLILPTGTRMKLPEMYGIDSYRDETVWNNNNIIFQNCDMHDYDVLHDGPATLIISEQTPEDLLQTHTLLVETENIVFILEQIKKNICVWNTSHTNRTSTIVHIKRQYIYASYASY